MKISHFFFISGGSKIWMENITYLDDMLNYIVLKFVPYLYILIILSKNIYTNIQVEIY